MDRFRLLKLSFASAAVCGFLADRRMSHYNAAKAGAIALARVAAVELGANRIRVNVIAPGVVETPLTAQIKDDPDWYDAYARKSALARWSARKN